MAIFWYWNGCMGGTGPRWCALSWWYELHTSSPDTHRSAAICTISSITPCTCDGGPVARAIRNFIWLRHIRLCTSPCLFSKISILQSYVLRIRWMFSPPVPISAPASSLGTSTFMLTEKSPAFSSSIRCIINSTAIRTDSSEPFTSTSRSSDPLGASEMMTLAPDFSRMELIISPPLPIIEPTKLWCTTMFRWTRGTTGSSPIISEPWRDSRASSDAMAK
mmetsp:Transcript_18166/g.51237  ORF Transcript_18166/g.51237 Transcript_18166/m.51237 type:complete len:220 (-) Transcript_18166:279-938(-)